MVLLALLGFTDILILCSAAAGWTLLWAGGLVYVLLRPPQWVRKRPMGSVVVQAVWTLLTWAVWVAATATMTRALPLLTPKARCAGADYCMQLEAVLGSSDDLYQAELTLGKSTGFALAEM